MTSWPSFFKSSYIRKPAKTLFILAFEIYTLFNSFANSRLSRLFKMRLNQYLEKQLIRELKSPTASHPEMQKSRWRLPQTVSWTIDVFLWQKLTDRKALQSTSVMWPLLLGSPGSGLTVPLAGPPISLPPRLWHTCFPCPAYVIFHHSFHLLHSRTSCWTLPSAPGGPNMNEGLSEQQLVSRHCLDGWTHLWTRHPRESWVSGPSCHHFLDYAMPGLTQAKCVYHIKFEDNT